VSENMCLKYRETLLETKQTPNGTVLIYEKDGGSHLHGWNPFQRFVV
jgi:hypothetical protein